MRYITGKLESGRIRIKVGIRPFRDYSPVDGNSTPFALEYTQFIALVDTGATRTCVTENVVQKLGLQRRGREEIWNIKRPELHWTYMFHVGIWPEAENGTPQTVFGIGDEIVGIDVGNNRFFDVLLGMDIIGQGSLHLRTDGTFQMGFPG